MSPLERRIDRLLTVARDAGAAGPPKRGGSHLDGEQLFAYWERDLDPEERHAAEGHALECESCLRWLLEVGKLFDR